MKKNNLIKVLTGISTSILLGMGLNSITHSPALVHAADSSTLIGTSSDGSVNISRDEKGTILFKAVFPTVDVSVKNDNPVLLEIDNDNNIKAEKSNYEGGQTVKVEYSVDFKNKKTGEPITGYFVQKKTIDGKEYGVFILADDVNTTKAVPTLEALKSTVQNNLTKAQNEYKEKIQKEAEEKQADLKKRYLYTSAKKKSTKKTLYYYTAYRKTSKVKKTKKTKITFIFKKNNYKIKAKTLKLDQAMKVGKNTYYHIKGKSGNFWVKSTDIKDLKPVFRKK